MSVQDIFLAATEIDDLHRRAEYLDRACAGDPDLRRKVNALIAAHERSGDFLDVPALQQMAGGPQPHRPMGERVNPTDEIDLSFLQPSSKPGSMGRLLHYEVQEVIGRGGFGIVLKAFDERLHRVVAIKTMSPELAVASPARKRFLREARATAAIRHENVVSIYAVEEKPLPFLVMEFIDGQNLHEKIQLAGPLELQDVITIGRQIAGGLAAAHAEGLIHRDIKPANILLERGTGRAKLTDFGLARAADDASLTQSGTVTGTPMYMSPEQAQGRAVDFRCDLFSLGSVLYVMCSGRPPFRAASVLAVMKRVVDEQPRPIREIIPEIPEWLVALISRLHAKDPQERFQSAQEVAELLERGQFLGAKLTQANPQAEPTELEVEKSHAQTPVAENVNPMEVTGKQHQGFLQAFRNRWRVWAGIAAILLLGFLSIDFLNRESANPDSSGNNAVARNPSGLSASPTEVDPIVGRWSMRNADANFPRWIEFRADGEATTTIPPGAVREMEKRRGVPIVDASFESRWINDGGGAYRVTSQKDGVTLQLTLTGDVFLVRGERTRATRLTDHTEPKIDSSETSLSTSHQPTEPIVGQWNMTVGPTNRKVPVNVTFREDGTAHAVVPANAIERLKAERKPLPPAEADWSWRKAGEGRYEINSNTDRLNMVVTIGDNLMLRTDDNSVVGLRQVE